MTLVSSPIVINQSVIQSAYRQDDGTTIPAQPLDEYIQLAVRTTEGRYAGLRYDFLYPVVIERLLYEFDTPQAGTMRIYSGSYQVGAGAAFFSETFEVNGQSGSVPLHYMVLPGQQSLFIEPIDPLVPGIDVGFMAVMINCRKIALSRIPAQWFEF